MEKEMALKNCIMKGTVGSRLYGTNLEKSDTDYVGIFIPNEEYLLGMKTVEQVDLSEVTDTETIDYTCYTLKKFCKLASECNPNIIEILFIPDHLLVTSSDVYRELLSIRHSFISKSAKARFLGYAFSQKHKMVIKLDNLKAITDVIDQLDKVKGKFLYLFEAQIPLRKSKKGNFYSIGDVNVPINAPIKRALKILNRRAGKFSKRKELYDKFGYDTKFAMHLIRLMYEGLHILKYGELKFPLDNSDYLLDIRNGKFSLKEVVAKSELLENQIEDLFIKSSLNKTADIKTIEKFLIKAHVNKIFFLGTS